MAMLGSDDNLSEKLKTMADSPPPPPVSPMRTPNTLRVARGGGGGDENVAFAENDPDRLMSPPLLLEIEEGTPAAEALKANADVRVSKLRKVGRSTRLQAGVRVLKSAARTASGQPGHTSDRRGDPAFVAPRGNAGGVSALVQQQQPPTIPEGDDEGGDEGGSDHENSSGRLRISNALEGGPAAVEVGFECHGSEDDSVSIHTSVDKSIHLDDSSTDRNKELKALPAPIPIHKHRVEHRVTHAALPAAIAAACRAGEDMDRQRASQLENNKGGELDAGRVQRFTHVFKPPEKKTGTDDDPGRLSPRQQRDRLTSSLTLPFGKHPQIHRRMSLEHNDDMPSEISIAETEKCTNLRQEDIEEMLEDLSDDGELLVSDEVTREATPHIQVKKVVQVDPIVVEIPGSNLCNVEESKDEEFAAEEEDSGKEFIAKAKKKISKLPSKTKGLIDDEAFHFPGPKSVRKWVKRQRMKEESKIQRSYVTGKVIDKKHDQYITSIAVMFGMRTSIGRTNLAMSQTAHNERRWLDNDDTMAVEKYEFPPRVTISNNILFYFIIHVVLLIYDFLT